MSGVACGLECSTAQNRETSTRLCSFVDTGHTLPFTWLMAGALSMFLGWTPISTLRKSVITEEAAFLLFFICSRTRCSAVSPSESSASRFASKRQKNEKCRDFEIRFNVKYTEQRLTGRSLTSPTHCRSFRRRVIPENHLHR